MLQKILEILDKVSPLFSGFGVLIAIDIFVGHYEIFSDLFYNIREYYGTNMAYFVVFGIIYTLLISIGYFMCPCTHNRKYMFLYSSGSLGGFIGGLLGSGIAITPFSGIFFGVGFGNSAGGFYFFPPLFAVILSYLFHKRADKKIINI